MTEVNGAEFPGRYAGMRGNVGGGGGEAEDWKYHAAEFAKGVAEMSVEFGRGVRDVVRQSLLAKDSYFVRNFGEPCARACERLRFLNEYLPEDRDPVHSWTVVFFVAIVALAGNRVDAKVYRGLVVLSVRKILASLLI